MKKWRVSNYRPINKNTLQGAFDLDASPLRIEGVMHFKKGDKEWVSFPSKEYMKDGEIKYAPILKIPDDDTYFRFQAWCLAELKQITSEDQVVPESQKDHEQDRDGIPF